MQNNAKNHNVHLLFTPQNQTPHHYIQKLPQQLNNLKTHIHLPTSHFTHHSPIFPQPPLTISPPQFYNQIHQIHKHINLHLNSIQNQKPP
ncbi:NYN domain-containing protein, partial [Priestia megaterium]|uniref:NYN domain-containing protein n=1 Tax=Priestia megaterium TaxID=1404 RepID=UPI0039A16559